MAARASYGRLLAFLVSRTGDVAAAEDALAEAFLRALETWPADGVPERPEAWLLTAARRRQIDGIRRTQAATAATQALIADAERSSHEPAKGLDHETKFPDERLKLLFLCAHPAIDASVRTPLMLQTVLGIDAATIASAFLVAPSAMGQRLLRAKTKIRGARIELAVPDEAELPERLGEVLDAVYAAYGLAWDRGVAGSDPQWRGLSEEAVWLARLIVELLPAEPEAKGLLALTLYCESRQQTRRNAAGGYVALSEQDASQWLIEPIREAEGLLESAASARTLGRYQIEAAIQSAHARRAFGGTVDWRAVAELYSALMQIAPSAGALVGQAAAAGEAFSPEEGMRSLEELDDDLKLRYQPYWALKAHLLKRLGQVEESQAAYGRAIGLSEDPAVREFLRGQIVGG